ncbi:MAG: RHS repeat-associated core domain-containing protein, partial [Prevotella sp.]
VMQTMNYYPFGAQFCDGSANNNDVQPYKYNGKELDKMHGLNTYDYGARQYNPVTARWDRVDPLAEKYYNVSPYAYCHNNPVMLMDPDGMDDYYTSDGTYLGTNSAESDYIYISDDYRELKDGKYVINLNTRVGLPSSDISAEALSKIFIHIVGRMPEVDLTQIDCNQINVVKWSRDAYSNTIHVDSHYGNVMVVMIKQMRAH